MVVSCNVCVEGAEGTAVRLLQQDLDMDTKCSLWYPFIYGEV